MAAYLWNKEQKNVLLFSLDVLSTWSIIIPPSLPPSLSVCACPAICIFPNLVFALQIWVKRRTLSCIKQQKMFCQNKFSCFSELHRDKIPFHLKRKVKLFSFDEVEFLKPCLALIGLKSETKEFFPYLCLFFPKDATENILKNVCPPIEFAAYVVFLLVNGKILFFFRLALNSLDLNRNPPPRKELKSDFGILLKLPHLHSFPNRRCRNILRRISFYKAIEEAKDKNE